MEDSSKKTITKNLIRIKEVLCVDLDFFVDELIQKDIFDLDIKDKLDGSQIPKDKSDIFIRMVVHKGTKACDEFVKLLHENKYELMTTEEVESKGSGGKEESFVYIREVSFLVSDHMGGEGACGEGQGTAKSPREISTLCLATKEQNTQDTSEMKYNHLQNTYKGAKDQLEINRNQISKLKSEKKELEKKLEMAENENKDLKHSVTELKTELQSLKMHAENKANEISEIKEKINKIEEMLKEDREWKNKLGNKLNDNGEELVKISDYIRNLEIVYENDSRKTDNSEQKPKLKPGTENKSNNLNNSPIKKAKGNGRKN